MKTILITAGTQGIGKGITIYHLKKGNCVTVIGHSNKNGELSTSEVSKLGLAHDAIFMQVDLSSVKENAA